MSLRRWTQLIESLCIRKQNTTKAVPLDVVPEYRTPRCSPRFRLGDRFSELSFINPTSPEGSEGEICRPLFRLWQLPFIHSLSSIHKWKRLLFIDNSVVVISSSWYLQMCLCGADFTLRMRSCRDSYFKVDSYFVLLTHAHFLNKSISPSSRLFCFVFHFFCLLVCFFVSRLLCAV